LAVVEQDDRLGASRAFLMVQRYAEAALP